MSEAASSVRRDEQAQLRAAGAMGAATFISRILGLVREQVFAYFFGASNATDAFQVAFRIPNLLRDLFAEGAMSAALVPTFTRARIEEGDARAWRLAGLVFRVLFVSVSIISLLGIWFAPQLVSLYAGTFREISGKFELTVRMTRTLFPFFPLVALAAAYMGILNACGRFFLPAFSSALFNLASVVSGLSATYFLTSTEIGRGLGLEPIEGMAWGVVLGGGVQAFAQLPTLYRAGYRYPRVKSSLAIDRSTNWPRWYQDTHLRKMLALMLPGTLGLAATQINLLVNTVLATSQGPGAVSYLSYAFRLMQFPIGVFGASLAAATLPRVSRLWVSKDIQGIDRSMTAALRQVFAVNLPASAGLAFLAEPIIELIYQYGRFDATSSKATAQVLMVYALGLTAYSSVKVLVPAFYAMGDTRVPVISSTLSVGLTLALNLALVPTLGILGLPLGTSIAAFFNAAFLWVSLGKSLRKDGGTLSFLPLMRVFCVQLGLALVMGSLCRLSWVGIETIWPEGGLGLKGIGLVSFRVVKSLLLVSEGVLIIWIGARMLKLVETLEFLDVVFGKVARRLRRIF